MNVQSLETTGRRVELYRQAMREAGYDEAAVAANLADSWVWRNIFVAATDAEAERIGDPGVRDDDPGRGPRCATASSPRPAMRIAVPPSDLPVARAPASSDGLIYGSPATVAEAIAALDATRDRRRHRHLPARADAARSGNQQSEIIHAAGRTRVQVKSSLLSIRR